MSFDFDGAALRPDYILKCSYGNDSIALLQFVHEYDFKHWHGGKKVVVLYNDTGWAAKWWEGRVAKGEALSKRYGFIPARTESVGMEELIIHHNAWPDRLRRFCTEELKIIPTQYWLAQHDPEGVEELLCGVRREESKERALWPEYVQADSTNENRSQWSPLVEVKVAERDEMIKRAGWEVLPHRSRECRCVFANSTDIKSWDENDISQVERNEAALGALNRERDFSNKFMFHPFRKKGRPEGIRQVVEWAKKVPPKQAKLEPGGGCDSGYCTG